MSELLTRVRAFIADDVDERTRAELEALIAAGDTAELEDRFRGPLKFGTAGLRGLVGAGENRMNRAVVIRATYGLVQHLIAEVPDAKSRGVVIARDARNMSDVFQRDAAEVCAAAGVKVHWVEGPTPTPVAAFAVTHLRAAGGIVVTASHNPPEYNGYKVYWENGAQIVPPVDVGIAEAIAAAPASKDIPRSWEDTLIVSAESVKEDYLQRVDQLRFAVDAPVETLRVAYSAMHGVGDAFVRAAFERRGFTQLFSVPAQAEPDPGFPTVRFPNPEEPGALDLVIAHATENDCDLILVNDPDADRLGAAVKTEEGYQVLSGNEIGVLFAHHLMSHVSEGERIAITTIVSSQMLKKMAAAHGVAYAETLTGFKWIANMAMDRPERFLFGYEEALGYTVGTLVRDKDGVGAAVVFAEMAAMLKGRGLTLVDQLEALRADFGLFRSKNFSMTLPGAEGAAQIKTAMTAIRERTFTAWGGTEVSRRWDLAEETGPMHGNVLLFDLADGGRVSIRPSGTEPKIKFYLEVVEPAGPEAERQAEARLERIQAEVKEASGL